MMLSSPSSPLLSIVIPTKNRYATLIPVLEAIVAIVTDARLEIVVQDNSDDPYQGTNSIVALNDDRVNYSHTAGLLSIVENTEIALGRARGEYITFIGDDDFVAPDIMETIEKAAAQGIEALIYPAAYYWWHTVKFATPSRFHQPGAFWLPKEYSDAMEIIDSAQALRYTLDQGAVSLFNLPRVYHGIVKRDLLNRIHTKTGRFVNGASPDMALAVATALTTTSHWRINRPLTIYGASRGSGGGMTAENRHFGKISDTPHLPSYTKEHWNPRLPDIWSEHTIYPQTAGEVLQFMGEPDTINYSAFYASMLVNEKHLRRLLVPLAIRHLRDNPRHLTTFLTVLIRKLAGQTRRGWAKYFVGMPYDLDIIDSPAACMRHLAESRRRC